MLQSHYASEYKCSVQEASWATSASSTLLLLCKQVFFMEVKKKIIGEMWQRLWTALVRLSTPQST